MQNDIIILLHQKVKDIIKKRQDRIFKDKRY